MTPQVETKPKLPPPPEGAEVAMTRLAAVYFVNSVVVQGFGDKLSVDVPGAGQPLSSSSLDAIVPAVLLPSGEAIPASGDEPTGLMLTKLIHDRQTGKRFVARTYVPFANIRSISYGAP